MVRIKLNLFESIICAIFLPNIGFVFTTISLIISLFVKQEPIVYKGILISYIVCLALMLFSVAVCILVNRKSKKEFILYDDSFEFLNHKYFINQIISCKYYVCKWYSLPIAFIYKNEAGGLIDIKLNTSKHIYFKIFYKDYLKLKKYIPNLIEK